MISEELKKRFESIIEIHNIQWSSIDAVAKKDANILRPIKGIAFEEYIKKIIKQADESVDMKDGVGDSDVDLYVNGIAVQVKTPVVTSTKRNIRVGVALHKTHGDETAPFNLYPTDEPPFDILCAQHPDKGVYIVPFKEIPRHKRWDNRLADPAYFPWTSEWLDRWDLLGLDHARCIKLDHREVPKDSALPFLSSQTYLEDYEIVEMLCKPEYFRAAVMGLKGNLKEQMFIQQLMDDGITVDDSIPTYSTYDALVTSNSGEYRVQIKGTSKNMCELNARKLGTEVMGTHGQFPARGYKRSSIDYVAIIISKDQLPLHTAVRKVNFVIIPTADLPIHYLVGNGDENVEKGCGNKKWNLPEYSDVIYPNLKFRFEIVNDDIIISPDIDGYRRHRGFDVIPLDSEFRNNKRYVLNAIPEEWR